MPMHLRKLSYAYYILSENCIHSSLKWEDSTTILVKSTRLFPELIRACFIYKFIWLWEKYMLCYTND